MNKNENLTKHFYYLNIVYPIVLCQVGKRRMVTHVLNEIV